MPTPSKTKPEPSAEKGGRFRNPFKAEPRHWAAEWSLTILILIFATSLLLQAFVVPSGSMENTLLIGDHLFVDKLAYSPYGDVSRHLLPYQDVRRGDVIVFRYPVDINKDYVKRVVGVPGDRLHLKDGVLWLNGHPVKEPYVIHSRPGTFDEYRDNFPLGESHVLLYPRARQMLDEQVVNGELVVPAGCYFAMGDNRENSEDSRYWGFVPRENIKGKPVIVWWSFDAPTERLASGNIDLGHIADIVINFFTKTRWERTFKLIRSYPLQ
jgi:signal peptidase I